MTPPHREIRWLRRARPLVPVAALGIDASRQSLLRNLLRRDAGALAVLEGVGGPDAFLVRGPAALLPWVDGVVYLGEEPGVAQLWLPTHSRPDIPPTLLLEALQRRLGVTPPLAVTTNAVIPCGELRPLTRDDLEARVR